MPVPEFTLPRFGALALAAIFITFATTTKPTPRPHGPEPLITQTPQPIHPIQRPYPPLAR